MTVVEGAVSAKGAGSCTLVHAILLVQSTIDVFDCAEVVFATRAGDVQRSTRIVVMVGSVSRWNI